MVDPFLPPLYDDYDMHPDGRTLVMVRPANSTQGSFTVELFHKLEASEVAGGVETHDIFGSFHGTIASRGAAK